MARTKSSSQWLRRHVTDPFVKQAQKDGYRSRSAYKLLELDQKDRKQARKAITASRLRPSRLGPEERENLKRIAGQVEKKRLAYEAAAAAVPFPMPDLYKKKRKKRGRRS